MYFVSEYGNKIQIVIGFRFARDYYYNVYEVYPSRFNREGKYDMIE